MTAMYVLCDCGAPRRRYAHCAACARRTDRDIERLLGEYRVSGDEVHEQSPHAGQVLRARRHHRGELALRGVAHGSTSAPAFNPGESRGLMQQMGGWDPAPLLNGIAAVITNPAVADFLRDTGRLTPEERAYWATRSATASGPPMTFAQMEASLYGNDEAWQRRQRELDIEDLIGDPIPAPDVPEGMAEIRFLGGPYAGRVQRWDGIARPARLPVDPDTRVEYDVRPWSLHPNRAYAIERSATAPHRDSAYLTAGCLISDEALVRFTPTDSTRMVHDLRRHLVKHCAANGQEPYPNTFEVQAVRDDTHYSTRLQGRIQTRPTGSATVAQAPQPFPDGSGMADMSMYLSGPDVPPTSSPSPVVKWGKRTFVLATADLDEATAAARAEILELVAAAGLQVLPGTDHVHVLDEVVIQDDPASLLFGQEVVDIRAFVLGFRPR